VLPDELKHQELIEVGIEQRPDYWVKFPVVVMRAFGEVDDHAGLLCGFYLLRRGVRKQMEAAVSTQHSIHGRMLSADA
jgi:hypothetical protein